jgi:ABC-2 type transport system permease protein
MFERITLYENYVKALAFKKLPDGRYKVTLTAGSAKFYADSLGNLKKYPVSDYMDIGLFAVDSAGGRKKERPLLMQRVKMDKPEKIFEFFVNEKPYSAGVDPYLKLIDRTPDNNNCRFGEKPILPELKEGADGFSINFKLGD